VLWAFLYHKPLKHHYRDNNYKTWLGLATGVNPAVVIFMQELVTGSTGERAVVQVTVTASSVL